MNSAWFLAVAAGQAAQATGALPPLPVSLSLPASTASAHLALPWWRVGVLFAIFAVLLGIWAWLHRGRLTLGRFLEPATKKILFHEQRWLNSRTVIYMVEVEGERFLLAQSQGAVSWQPLKNASANSALPSSL